jgi:hypothetical protein
MKVALRPKAVVRPKPQLQNANLSKLMHLAASLVEGRGVRLDVRAWAEQAGYAFRRGSGPVTLRPPIAFGR